MVACARELEGRGDSAPREGRIGPGQFDEIGLGASEDQRQAVLLGRAVQMGEARSSQQSEERFESQGFEFAHPRDVQGAREGFVRRERSFEAARGVLGAIVAPARRDVEQPLLRQDPSLVQQESVEEGFERAGRRTGREGEIDVLGAGVADPGAQARERVSTGDLRDQHRKTFDALQGQFL